MREDKTGVSRETFGRETGQTGGSGGQVRQARQVGSTQVVQAAQAVRSQVRQARQALRRSGGSGAPHSGRCAPYVWHVPMQKACHSVLISVK